MPFPNRNGYYTGQMFTNEFGERYVWVGNEWKSAGNDNYTPVAAAKEVNITFNTFLEEGGNPIQAKVYVNDKEWADSTSQNGKITLKFFDYQILNPTKISFIGTNVKSKKTFVIQARVNQENDVVIKDADEYGNIIDGPISTPYTPSSNSGGGGASTNYGGGGYTYLNDERGIVLDRQLMRNNIE